MSGIRFRFLAVAAPLALALALIASPALAQGTPWHLDAIDQRSLPYDNYYNPNGTGSGVTVYILGTGIDPTHVEFEGRAQTSWSAFANPDDELGHGTWVASLVGGGTYGVAKSVQLRGVKVIDDCGTVNPTDIVAGLDWVRNNAGYPAVAVVTFAFDESSAEIDAAISNLVASGIPTVVPAGNVRTDACNLSPAGVGSAVTVGAHDQSLSIASGQAYGSCIDIYAPGVDITGAWHTTNTATNTLAGPDTAAAAAIVAGAIAVHGSQSAMMAAATSMGVWLRVYV